MAKPHSAVRVEENGVMYVTKRISANHKITIPMRKRRGNILEKCKIEGIPGESFSSSGGNSGSSFALLEGHAHMLDNSLSAYSKQDEYVFDGTYGNFPLSCIEGMTGINVNSQNTVPYPKNANLLPSRTSGDHIYSQNRDTQHFINGSHDRYQNTNNQYPPMMMGHTFTQHEDNYMHTKVLMPNYYHYNKQIMNQIVKQLQITIQNILQRNAEMYSCYDSGSQNGWEVHNPKEGPVISIKFKDNKRSKEDHMNLFHPEVDSFAHTNANDQYNVSEQDKLLCPVKKVPMFPVAKKSTASRQLRVKSCFVKINKLSENELTSYINEKDYDSDGEDSSGDDSVTNKCMKCDRTFKLRIQLAHHKCDDICNEVEDSIENSADKTSEIGGSETVDDKKGNEFLVPICPSYSLPSQNEEEESTLNPDQVIKSEKVVPLSEIENIIMNPELTIYEMNDDESMSHLQQSLYCSKCVNCEKEVVGKEGEYCEKCEMEGSLNSNDQDEFLNVDAKRKSSHSGDVSQLRKTKATLQTNYQECPYCKKRFSPYYSLKYHTSKCDKNTHCFCKIINMNNKSSHVQCYLCAGKNEVEVMCRVCEKTFSNNNKLRRHMVIHSGVKRYICSQCGKRFGRSDHLKLHKQTHSGTKPYMCSTCGKCFTTKQSVKFHMRLHSGVKPYSCNFCGKRFVQLAALKTHLQVHSSNKTYRRRPKI